MVVRFEQGPSSRLSQRTQDLEPPVLAEVRLLIKSGWDRNIISMEGKGEEGMQGTCVEQAEQVAQLKRLP